MSSGRDTSDHKLSQLLHFALNTFPQPADRDQPDARNLRHLCAQLRPGLLCGLPHRGKGVQGDADCKTIVSIFGIYRVLFLTVPPNFQYQNEKTCSANEELFFIENFLKK